MTRTTPALAAACAALALVACESKVRPIVTQGDGLGACALCHGDAARDADGLVRAAPPVSTRVEGDGGAHLAHLTGSAFRAPLACAECHYVPTLVDHADGAVQVPMAGLAAVDGATPAWSAASATCSGVYCHGATLGGGPAATPAWSSTADLGCASCHGLPPPAPHPAGASCGTCHPGYTSSTVNAATHLDGAVQGGGHPAGYADPGQHGPAANAGGLASCQTCHGTGLDGGTSGVSCEACHAGAGFPDWETTCTFCHGDADVGRTSPPVDTAGRSLTSNVSVGAHDAHVAATLTAPLACTECHPDRAGSNVVTDAAHVDGDGRAEVDLGARAGASATYTRVSDTSATCSSTRCHGTSPVEWTSTAALGCASCHGAPPASHDPAATACGTCHVGYTASSVDPATHVDGLVQGGHPSGYVVPSRHGYDVNDFGLDACTTCHGSDLNGGVSGVSCNDCHGGTAWQTSCTFCHGSTSSGRSSPPVDTHGLSLTSNVSVGAHDAHATTALTATPIGCAVCHPDRAASNVVTDAGHVDGDGRAEVVLGARAGASAIYARASDTSATCASTSCHGASAIEWTSTAPLGCGSCHGAPPAGHAVGDCANCHPGYTASSVDPATHIDGDVEATNPHAGGYGAGDVHGYEVNRIGLSTCKTCHGPGLEACDACHGGTAAWRTSCTFCHGNPSTLVASPPVDTQGRSVTTNVSVGVHASHVATSMATPIACTQCHANRTGSDVTADAAHVDGDGIAEVAFGAGVLARTGGASPVYTRASAVSATCASTYCHGRFTGGANSGSGATVNWTSTTAVTCTSCHGTAPNTGEHSKHVSRMQCNICHFTVVDSTRAITGAALHVNGTDDVAFGGTYGGNPVTGTWTPPSPLAAGRCSNLSCHGNEVW